MNKKDLLEGLDTPLKYEGSGWLNKINKGGKIRIVIIFEDNSYIGYFSKLKDEVFKIKKKAYLIDAECIVNGKNPTLFYYYDNPHPIKFKYQRAGTIAPMKVSVNSTLLNTVLNTNVVNKMYSQGQVTPKAIIIILVVVAIIVLIFLQVFGVVDVMGMISGTAQKMGGG